MCQRHFFTEIPKDLATVHGKDATSKQKNLIKIRTESSHQADTDFFLLVVVVVVVVVVDIVIFKQYGRPANYICTFSITLFHIEIPHMIYNIFKLDDLFT